MNTFNKVYHEVVHRIQSGKYWNFINVHTFRKGQCVQQISWERNPHHDVV